MEKTSCRHDDPGRLRLMETRIKTFAIHSSQSMASLSMQRIGLSQFSIEARMGDECRTVLIDGFSGQGVLLQLFRKINQNWLGWDGALQWEARDASVRLSVTYGNDHAQLEVAMPAKDQDKRFTSLLCVPKEEIQETCARYEVFAGNGGVC